MAYSFNDHFRPLRMILRLNGLLVGLGLGVLLLIYPDTWLAEWGFSLEGPAWPSRLAGASLIGLGTGLLVASREPYLRPPALVSVVLANALIAVVLLVAYLQRELATLILPGRLALVVIFSVCLLSVVVPIPYFRGESRPEL
jgi:hypothetical protein